MKHPGQIHAAQQAIQKPKDDRLSLLDELGSYARRYDERVYPLDKGTQTVAIPLELLRKANLLSKSND